MMFVPPEPDWRSDPVPTYLATFRRYEKAEGMGPTKFARFALHYWPDFALTVLEYVGSWPSSEPELAALQRAFP